MGSGASMEEAPPQYSGPSRLPSGRSRSESAKGYYSRNNSARYDSVRSRPRSAISQASSRRSARSASWKEAIKSGSLQRSDSRKERAAALGRKSACLITLTKAGFSYQHVQICEGQVVTFEWDTDEGNGFNITQVIHDGNQYRPVIGGVNSGPISRHGFFEHQFNMEGTYKFVSSGFRCTPLNLEVYPRKDVEATLTDEGFTPKIVRIDEGNAVEWAWSGSGIAHSITEMKYSHKLGALVRRETDTRPLLTKSGSFRREFNKPGLYYFQSEGGQGGQLHTTVVHVRERQQEFRIEVLDRAFNPPIVVIEEGDRIWWEWDKTKCNKPHCIYQVNPPPLDHPVEESFKPLKNGFKWPQPSPSGVLSHEFFTPGVYYFSDHNFQEAAEYIGTIIVKPKQIEHFVELSPDGFTPDLLYASTGDRIWWTWAVEEVDTAFNILEVEKCISPVGKRTAIESDDTGDGAYMDDELEHSKVETGLESVQMASVGVYQYRVSDSANHMSSCTVITQGGHRNHTVHVTDHGFEPKVVTIHPGDRIWWIWQDGVKQHNIIQVSHQGAHIQNGFVSGAPLDCPSAFVHQFRTPGVYYYIDDALAKSFGAVVVASQAQVHEIQVTANSIVRDPCVVTLNDVVAWTFRGLRQNDVQQGKNLHALTEGQYNSKAVTPRRCMNRVFTEKGVYHYSSKSFLRGGNKKDKTDEVRISTVLVDEVADSATVRVDGKGFHPNNITIRKGQSVLWTWKESGDQAHNIVNVNPPNSDAPLSVIQGGRSFNSGKPVAKNSFLYTFDESGEFCVASQGAPGHAGTVTVLSKAIRTGTPYITSSKKGGLVEKSHKVHLDCDTDRAKIFYTLDGSAPEMHKLTSKSSQYYELSYIKKHLSGVTEVYNPDKGIHLKHSGIVFVRAVAVREGILSSELFTSHRFIVSGDHEAQSSGPEEEAEDETQKQAMWHWWNCVPSIKAVITEPGVMEVFWEHPQIESRRYIKGYNLFLNGVTYCEMFPPTYNTVSIAGLAGDRMYEIYLEVYPNDPMYLPHKSNKVVMKIPKTYVTGGPQISLEATSKPDTLAIVWMSIDSDQCPIDGYRVYLNGQMCGNQVVPDANSDRCKVVIEGCQLNFVYKIMVAAIPINGGSPKQSNQIDITLPLDCEQITLPPMDARLDDDDLYREYIEIREGTGDHVVETKTATSSSSKHQQGSVSVIQAPKPASDQLQSKKRLQTSQSESDEDEGEASKRPSNFHDRYGDYVDHHARDQFYPDHHLSDDHHLPSLPEEGSNSVFSNNNEDGHSMGNLLRTLRQELKDIKSSHVVEVDQKTDSPNKMSKVKADPNWKYPGPKPLKKGKLGSQKLQEQDTNLSAPLLTSSGLINEPENHRGNFLPMVDPSVQNMYSQYRPEVFGELIESSENECESLQSPFPFEPTNNFSPPPKYLSPPAVVHDTPPRLESPRNIHSSRSGVNYYPLANSSHMSLNQVHQNPFYQVHHNPLKCSSLPNFGNMLPQESYSSLPVIPQTVSGIYLQNTYREVPLEYYSKRSNDSQQLIKRQQKVIGSNVGLQTNHYNANHLPQSSLHSGIPKVTPVQSTANSPVPLQPHNLLEATTTNPEPERKRSLSHWNTLAKGASMLNYVKPLKPKVHSVSISAPKPINQFSQNYDTTLPPTNYVEPYSKPPIFPKHIQLVPSSVLMVDKQQDVGMIDATLGPWKNKMKHAVQSMKAIKRMNQSTNSLVNAGSGNGQISQYEIEVQSDDEEERNYPLVKYGKKKRDRKKSPKLQENVVTVSAHVEQNRPPSAQEQAVPVIGAFDGDANLPAPEVSATSLGSEQAQISWYFRRSAEPQYRLTVCEVNVVGPRFKQDVNSDMSFESLQEDGREGRAVAAVQHRWNITNNSAIKVTGLWPGTDYQVYVVANYALTNAKQPYEIQAKSSPITYTSLGPPNAPTLKVVSTDMYQVTLGWEIGSMHRDVAISGFRVLIDGKQLGGVLSPNTRQSVIDNLTPSKSIRVQVQSLTTSSLGDSELSNDIVVHCPHKPPPPSISQQPSYKKGTVTIAWERPVGFQHANHGEDINFYRIYLDGVWHGEVKACDHCNRNGYQYLVTDMTPGQTYDVTVKSYAGQQKIDPTCESVFCICESDMSHALAVTCPAPPESPVLRLEGMHAEGIDVTWDMPQQFGDAQVSGYQMMKNGKLYGSIIPCEVHTLRIRGLSLGEKVSLQILALTDHPVGRDNAQKDAGKSKHGEIPTEIFNGERYSACTPGPRLTVIYTGLVQSPAKVWCEQVTGHSAMIVWQSEKRARPHYVFPDNYQVTWWPGDKPDQDINSQQTREDHLLITGLKPQTTYNIVVEARKVQKYGEMHGDTGHDGENTHTFILTQQSDKITVKTASPPSAPGNIGILATTCSSIQVGWDPPRDRGAEVIGMRVDAVAVKSTDRGRHVCVELTPDATSAVVEGLADRTEYHITVTAITEEYFDQLAPGHEMRRSRQLSKNKIPPEDHWLPSISILASTSGTIAPTDLRIVKTSINSVTLTWKPPQTYGSNRLQGTTVRWAEGKFTSKSMSKDDGQLAHHRSMEAESNKVTIEGLHPGILYKVVVEAVVSVKTTLQSKVRDPEGEKMNRRTTHVMSKPLFVRTRAPCEKPKPIITGYTQNTIQLYWEKPILYSAIGRDDSGNTKYLKLSLEGYRLEINGKPHMRLMSNAQSCTLVKCKSGKKYKIVLVALTCTEEVKKDRRRKAKGTMNMSLSSDTLSQSTTGTAKEGNQAWEMTSEDLENDESPSQAIEVTLPRNHDGLLKEASVTYRPAAEMNNREREDEEKDLGDMQLDWNVQGDTSIVKNFNLTWHCHADGAVQKKVVDGDVRTCMIPVQHRRCLYDITIEADYHKSVSVKDIQPVQLIIPGSPDAPEIWTKSVTNTEFVIEWAEPRLYGAKIKGYQVYMNGKKVGNMLNNHHRKAVIPCKPRRQYKVNLVAIPNDNLYPSSEWSNTLLIHTGGQSIEPSSLVVTEEMSRSIQAYDGDSDDLPVKVIKVTESSIHLDWSNYTEVDGMSHYKVLWSSVAQPAEKEVKLPAGERSCVIHKCYPGTNHYIRIYACALDERILDKSQQIQAQTSASPDTPTVSLRACNFKYIAIQWDQPKHYGDASIIGYKVFVNGVVEAILGPENFTYTLTQGKWCKEYSFQVQAQTSHDTLNSKPSDPLVVTWPGVQSPNLSKTASLSGGNAVKIVWDTPDTTEGVKIKEYRLLCLDEETQRLVQSVNVHADSNEAEVQNLQHGNYVVYMEVHVHGTTDVVKSDSLRIKPSITPDPPYITVTVIGLEQRRQIEKITTCLINQRDRYLSILNNAENKKSSPGRYNEDDQVMKKAAESLAQVEERLDDCLSALNHYTGHILAHVSWTCAQSNPDVRVTGYKVLVDGKQYGTTLHAGVKNIRIKLGLNQPSHRLSMVSVCDRPQTTSNESNAVELLTEPFLPFTYYSFLTQDPKSKGMGPSYQEALALERKQKNQRTVSQGLIKKKVSPPACTLYDIFQGAYHPLFPPSGPRLPTAILFWAKWCYSSRRMLEWFVKYARNHSSQYEFIAISCTPSILSPADRQDLVEVITQNGWRDDNNIRHLTSRSANEITLKPSKDCYWNHGFFTSSVKMEEIEGRTVMCLGMSPFNPQEKINKEAHEGLKSTDMCEIFGVQGVPTVVVVHPEGYIAWKGRYCAFDYPSYDNFINYIFAQSLKKPNLPTVDPWDTTIDVEELEGLSKHPGDSSHLIHRPTSALHRQNSTTSTTIHMNGSARPQSGKRLFTRSEKKITVDMRPYSANSMHKSPYAQKVTPAHKKGKSAKKAKSTY